MTLHIILPGSAPAVRAALHQLFAEAPLHRLSADERGEAELVLAEALNNIVEHAYAGAAGDIDLQLDLTGDGLLCRITDSGTPMPRGALPAGLAPLMAQADDPPEGGFGWFLIRSLAQDLAYGRDSNCNRLSFRLLRKQSV